MIPGITLPSDYARLALKVAPYILLAIFFALWWHRGDVIERQKANNAALVSMYAQRTAKAQLADAEHARTVEAVQTKTTQEVSSAYQNDLAALRARYDRLRASPTTKGDGGAKSVPSPTQVPSGPDATGACEDPQLMFDAQADALQLTAIQNLIRDLGMAE